MVEFRSEVMSRSTELSFSGWQKKVLNEIGVDVSAMAPFVPRGTLQAIAKRYRVKSITRFLEGCLAAEDRKGSEQVLFRIYEK